MVYATLNESSWILLDKLHLAEFFDSKGIPPLIFPVFIILILLFLSISFYSPSASIEPCGDGLCDSDLGESVLSCPQDCTKDYGELKDVKVEIVGDVLSVIKITLEDSEGNLLQTDLGPMNDLYIYSLTVDAVLATVTNPLNAESFDSGLVTLTEQFTIIPMGLPPNFFQNGATSDLRVPLEDFIPTELEIRDTDGDLLDVQNMSNMDDLNLTNGTLVYIKVNDSNETWVSDIINGTENQTITLSPIVENPEESNCSDGTPLGHCSVIQPDYCSASGALLANCDICSCPSGETCQGDGTCLEPSVIEPGTSLNCIGIKGDLNGGGDIDITDVTLLSEILDDITSTGFSQDGVDNMDCADANGDNYLTNEDEECLNKILDLVYNSVSECPDCVPDNESEICNDGVDNDCDGQIDVDTYDEDENDYYGFESDPDDLCECLELTPCDMIRVNNEFDGLIETNIKYCSSISGLNSGQYNWYSKDEWKCTPESEGELLLCDDRSYDCTNNYDWYGWEDSDFYKDYECFGKDESGSSSCQAVEGFACGSSACDTDQPGYFDEVRGYSGSGAYWGSCPIPDSIESYCQCRCNRDKLYCGDSSASVDDQSCWVPAGDDSCDSAEEYEYCDD